MREYTIHPLVVGINEMADILIPIHDAAVGRKKCIPEYGK